MTPGRISKEIESMRRDMGGKRKSEDERGTCLGVVSVLDPSLGAALDHPTCSPASPTISTDDLDSPFVVDKWVPTESTMLRVLNYRRQGQLE
jgi:hypothetical protein